MTQVRKRISTLARALLAALMLVCVLVPLPACTSSSSSPVAQIALSEFEVYAENSGEKYWSWMGFSSREEWCACFASWCADQAGLIEEGYAPKDASVLGWIQFYKDNPEAGSLVSGDGYAPAPGDFIIWQRSLDPDAALKSHIGIVESYDAATQTVYTIEGNSGDSLRRNAHKAGSGISFYAVPAAGGSLSGLAGCSSALGGKTVVLPQGLGDSHTFMGWQLVTNKTSAQYKLRQMAGESYDAEGFAKIGSRYVVACTETYGSVGDYINVTQTDGLVIECIIGDIKSQSDEGCNKWGHEDGNCVIEFVVDYGSWYGVGHANPGSASCHPEWDCDIASITNLGSYFDGATAGSGSAAALGLYGCSTASPSSGSGENALEGVEGQVASALLENGLGRTQTAAMLAVLEATRGMGESDWPDVAGQVGQVMSAYRSWAPAERLAFESISDPGQAAEALGRGFAGLADDGTDWTGIRASAESYYSRM